ncbi:MAG TPA: crossover junction endodeoxyribonuclease RuvC [Coriobacteriia bacterium]
MIILGIDPGLANTGWGVVEAGGNRLRCLGYGCVTTPAEDPLAQRLSAVHTSLLSVIREHEPAECAVEKLFFNVNVRTAFATGQARGVALLATAEARLRVGEYGPSEIKQAVVGYGGAEKSQVQYMVKTILGLPAAPKPDHAADALAVAICHANSRGRARLAEVAR